MSLVIHCMIQKKLIIWPILYTCSDNIVSPVMILGIALMYTLLSYISDICHLYIVITKDPIELFKSDNCSCDP